MSTASSRFLWSKLNLNSILMLSFSILRSLLFFFCTLATKLWTFSPFALRDLYTHTFLSLVFIIIWIFHNFLRRRKCRLYHQRSNLPVLFFRFHSTCLFCLHWSFALNSEQQDENDVKIVQCTNHQGLYNRADCKACKNSFFTCPLKFLAFRRIL